MDTKKRKRSNTNTQNHIDQHKTDAKPRRSLRIQSLKKLASHNFPDLPFDIIVKILSRLPVKLIFACKTLSKAFKSFLSDPSFSNIYLNNKYKSFYTIFVDDLEPEFFSLDLAEFDERDIYTKKGNHTIKKGRIFDSDKLPGDIYNKGNCEEISIWGYFKPFSIWGYCNGLFCFMKLEFGLCNLFVTNPILGEFIQLPEPVAYSKKWIFFSYGLGYCQLTNRYKVLRITKGDNGETNREIFTIGSDQSWRSISDVNVPYNTEWRMGWLMSPYPQHQMVSFRSSLHWISHPQPLFESTIFNPSWKELRGGTLFISTFDVTYETTMSAFPLPHEVAATGTATPLLTVLLEKLCVWQLHSSFNADLWVMDEYGVEESWTKLFVLKMLTLSCDIRYSEVIPLRVSAEGVIVVTDGYQVVFYDLKKEKPLRKVVQQPKQLFYPIPFVPTFVSLRNLARV